MLTSSAFFIQFLSFCWYLIDHETHPILSNDVCVSFKWLAEAYYKIMQMALESPTIHVLHLTSDSCHRVRYKTLILGLYSMCAKVFLISLFAQY